MSQKLKGDFGPKRAEGRQGTQGDAQRSGCKRKVYVFLANKMEYCVWMYCCNITRNQESIQSVAIFNPHDQSFPFSAETLISAASNSSSSSIISKEPPSSPESITEEATEAELETGAAFSSSFDNASVATVGVGVAEGDFSDWEGTMSFRKDLISAK